ncbi:hypothetical protein [Nonomuraea jabiensis]|uniref:Secreted protein n=1 Tax=Nonomuraea jabiensis TaxID=882448 RepID=A0A7W9G3G5_9ACTN|nr:hypothetical protein [Nonomuraea jabiensis]MBB5776513.1 hypothetical protein [Nonomuraea jabiensis]
MIKRAFPGALAALCLAALVVAPADAALATTIEIRPGHTGTVKESYSSFECPVNEVMTGREHRGDENGDTTYWCGRIYIDNEQATTVRSPLWARMPESNSFYTTNGNAAINSRDHWGDENGDTTYGTVILFWQGKPLRLVNRRWTTKEPESNHSSSGGALEVMTGRRHAGDENGYTAYEYATVTLG